MCYQCCTSRPDVSSCLFHFNMLPPNQQNSILAREQAAAAPPVISSVVPAVIADGLPIGPSSASMVLPPNDNEAAAVIQPPQPAMVAAPSEPWRDAINLLASQLAAISTQVANLSSHLSSPAPRIPIVAPSAPISNVGIPMPASIPQLSPSSRPVISLIPQTPAISSAAAPPANGNPHRQAVLGASATESAAIEEMINRVMRSAADDNTNNQDYEAKEVRNTTQTSQPGILSSGPLPPPPPPLRQPLAHIRSSIFPSTLAPPPLGGVFTEQVVSATGIKLTNANFFDPKKFKSIADLRTAFNDWETLAYRSGWSAHYLLCINRYKSLVIDTMAAASLPDALSYHLHFARAVDSGEHNMFGLEGSEWHVRSFLEVFPLSASSTTSGKKSNSSRPAKKNNGGKSSGKEDKTVFPAGSCTYHPKSVTHDTSTCSLNKARTNEGKSDK